MKIHYATTSVAHINWRGETTLQNKATSFSISEFRGMVHGLARTVKIMFFEDVMHFAADEHESVPARSWGNVYDDPSNGSSGWCFLNDQRTRLSSDSKTWSG